MALVIGTNCGFVSSAPVDDPEGTSTLQDNYAIAINDTAPEGAVKVTEIGWWCDNATQEANFEVAIYTDDAGHTYPKDLVGSKSDTNAKGTGAGWKRVTGLNISITAGNVYWIAVQLDDTSTSTQAVYDTLGGSTARSAISGASTLNDPWGSTNTGATYRAFYAVYETAAGGLKIPVAMHHYMNH